MINISQLVVSWKFRSLEKNAAMWQEMITGSEQGIKTCLRAKMDPKNANGALRDPVLYRCKPEPHVQFDIFLFIRSCNCSVDVCLTCFISVGPVLSIRSTQRMTLPARSLIALKE